MMIMITLLSPYVVNVNINVRHTVLRDQLHWLPIHQRIEFKIAVFVRNAVHGRGPTYLSRTCNPVRDSCLIHYH